MPRQKPTSGYYALRWKILTRDNFTCQFCGQFAPNVKLEVDHKIPVAEGGTDDSENLITACYACNRGKSALKIIAERKERLSATTCLTKEKIITTSKRAEVLVLLKRHPEGLSTEQIAQKLNTSKACVRVMIKRLHDRNLIAKKWTEKNNERRGRARLVFAKI